MARRLPNTWRWIATVAMVATAAFATTATLAAPAHAIGPTFRCTFASDEPSYVGWGSIEMWGCVAPGMAQTADCRTANPWRWTNTGWKRYSFGGCGGPGKVYVYPFAAGWSWIWTQQSGWVAIESKYVMVRSGYSSDYGCAVCV